MKKALLVYSVVFCTVSAFAQVPNSPEQYKLPAQNLLPIHAGDRFSVRMTDMLETRPSSLLKNGIRTAGLAAAAYQTDKIVEGGGEKPTITTVSNNWLAPVGVATTLLDTSKKS